MVLFCILFISNEAEHILIYLLVILISSFVKCPFKFYVQISIELHIFFRVHICRSFLYILDLDIW